MSNFNSIFSFLKIFKKLSSYLFEETLVKVQVILPQTVFLLVNMGSKYFIFI